MTEPRPSGSGSPQGVVGRSSPLLLISASTLLQELYWLRAFAEIEWAHLASMVVSTAMLGIGAGSVGILLAGERAERHAAGLWRGLLLGTTVSLAAVPWAIARLPLEPMLLAWRVDTWGWLLLRELLVALPLATATAAVTLALRLGGRRPGRLWGIHLLGASAGVAVGLALIPGTGLRALLVAALAAAALATLRSLSHPPLPRRAIPLVVVALSALGAGAISPPPPLSATKDLHALRALPRARILEERPGWEGSWRVVDAPSLHGLAGTSLQGPSSTQRQRAIVVRGDQVGTVLEAPTADVLRRRVAWLPYALRSPRSVLVLHEAGSAEIQTALASRADVVRANVADRRTLAALRGELGVFAGLDTTSLELVHHAPRALLAAQVGRFDLVVLPPHDSLGMASGGLHSTRENAELTVEGLRAAIGALNDEGQLAILRWTQAPPRDLARLLRMLDRVEEVGTALEPLRDRVALVRSWDQWCLTVARRPYTDAALGRLREFARTNGFDVLLPATERAAPVHRLPGPDPAAVVDHALVGAALDFEGLRDLDLRPATDDRPWFHHYLPISRIPRLLRSDPHPGTPPSHWGDFFLAGSLLSALVLGAAIILLPVLATRDARRAVLRSGTGTLLFVCLGLGYLMLEMLWLHVGSFALEESSLVASVVIVAFLLGSGLGSLTLARDPRRGARAALLVGVLAVLCAVALGWWRGAVLGWPTPLRWMAIFLPSLLIAVPMGVPLPSALAGVRARQVPWLLGVNAWASVFAPSLGTLLAIQLGTRGLGFVAAGLYGVAALALVRLSWLGDPE